MHKMKYKNFISTRYIIAMAVVLLIAITGCEKNEDTYKKYVTTAGNFKGNALEYLQSQPGVYDSMLLVINRLTGMRDSVSKEPITLFAVSNNSFALALRNINQARLDSIPAMPPVSLTTMDSAVLDTFFCRYLVKDHVLSDSMKKYADGLFFPTIRYNYDMQVQYDQTNASGYLNGGPKSLIYSYPGPNPDTKIFVRYWTRVNTMTVDIKTSNAIVHLLPPGHDFGFGSEFIRRVNKR